MLSSCVPRTLQLLRQTQRQLALERRQMQELAGIIGAGPQGVVLQKLLGIASSGLEAKEEFARTLQDHLRDMEVGLVPSFRPAVAVLDDEDAVARALERLLRVCGFQVTTFASAPPVAEAAAQGRFDCLLVDIHTGDRDGLRVADLFADSPVPLVTMSGDDSLQTRALVRDLAVVQHLHKPIDEEDLVAALLRAIAARPAG
jgi:CheY-like chemotaxis protein